MLGGYRWMGLGVSLMCFSPLTACQPAPPPPPPQTTIVAPPPPAVMGDADYDRMKQMYTTANPNALVGRVEAVLPDEQRAAIGGLPTDQFRVGDVLSIIDADQKTVADATVVAVDSTLVYVEFMSPTLGGGRAPIKGDVAIRAMKPDR